MCLLWFNLFSVFYKWSKSNICAWVTLIGNISELPQGESEVTNHKVKIQGVFMLHCMDTLPLLLSSGEASFRKELILPLRHSYFSQHFFPFHCRNRPINHHFELRLCKAKQFQLAGWWSLASPVKFPEQHLSAVHLPVPSLEFLLCQVHFVNICWAESQDWDAFKPKISFLACGIPCMQTYRCYNIDTGGL